jgi:hypothetical protein
MSDGACSNPVSRSRIKELSKNIIRYSERNFSIRTRDKKRGFRGENLVLSLDKGRVSEGFPLENAAYEVAVEKKTISL